MKNIILVLAFMVCMNASCQESKQLLDYFPNISNDSIIRTEQFVRLYYKTIDKNSFPDAIALKHFFDNNREKMEDVSI